jgi:chromatin remodeling complex protein RSC6
LKRTQIVKLLWVYIREHELQKEGNKQVIVCDDKLKAVFDGEDEVTMFSMNKFIGAHVSRADA